MKEAYAKTYQNNHGSFEIRGEENRRRRRSLAAIFALLILRSTIIPLVLERFTFVRLGFDISIHTSIQIWFNLRFYYREVR
jgi:hypothetical protein